jgi:hypothetical protein
VLDTPGPAVSLQSVQLRHGANNASARFVPAVRRCPSGQGEGKWVVTDKVRVVAYMWWCGDYECHCTQPVIERWTETDSSMAPRHRSEWLWEGTFGSLDSATVRDDVLQWRELKEAAERFGAEKMWCPEDEPKTGGDR